MPYFQPVVDLRSGSLAGFELLARQHHPIAGVIGPNSFIPDAENEGWINDLTFHLLEAALPAVADLPGKLFLAFNISTVQLHDPELPDAIRNLAERMSFPVDRLSVEVTESALLSDIKTARKIADRFRSFGCGLALDDFGTGYSSLKTLQALPFNILKVDRSFVSSMTTSKESRKIVAAVIGLGQSLEFSTVAEGIETQQENEMVDWLGCEFGQGWLHGKPVPPQALVAVASEFQSKRAPKRFAENLEFRRSLSRFDNPLHVRLAQLRSIYEAVPVGLAFVDCSERYLAINKRLADINAAEMVDHFGRSVNEMVPSIYPQVGPNLQRALRGESVLGSIVAGDPGLSGKERRFLVSYEPARDEGGEIVGASIAVLETNSLSTPLPTLFGQHSD